MSRKRLMDQEKIIARVQEANSTLLSFPDRGPWGENSYRGNCSGWIQAFLIWRYNVKKLAELFAGSGTGSDVAFDMGIDYIGADLNPNPKRNDILVCDAIKDEVPDGFRDADLLFCHPPYGLEIGIPYAGSMYPDPTGELSKTDLGQLKWDHFIAELNKVVMKYYAAMKTNSYMAILMGDVRRNGSFHSMFADIVKPGELEQVFIKAQHNCVSNGRRYSNRISPIVTETLMVIKKVNQLMVYYNIPRRYMIDIRDACDESASWKDSVMAVLRYIGKATLQKLYDVFSGHEKAKKNPHYKEKIRQTIYYLRNAGLVTKNGDNWIPVAA